ncbi:uncharacterized protein LOC113564255 [Drosophila erecta]|uniref:uncharacterized protein LOC113564255 n=1 Tax=Drosophila erecta TaxID=7220 RepID=UPI000F0629A1|nr:uncharacterized protein LOC113564255 [Drosophila erecta]
MDHLAMFFLIISLLSAVYYSTAAKHSECGPAGRCYTVNTHFGSFKQTRCVPCKQRPKSH